MQCYDECNAITLAAASYNISVPLPSTISSAHVDSYLKDQIKLHEDTDARYHNHSGMLKDNFLKDYLKQLSLPELRNYYKVAFISTAFPFERSVPSKTTTKS